MVQAETLAGAIEGAAMNVEFDMRAVAGLFEASEEVTAEEFRMMVERIQASAGLRGIAYAPLVSSDDLAVFESQTRVAEPGYSVLELNSAGEPVPVTARGEYFPIRYFHPSDVVGSMGLDVASVPDRLEFVNEAVSAKRAVATSLTRLAVSDQEGYVVYQPILDTDGEVTGLVVGPVLVESLIEAAVAPALAAGLDWTILDDDQTADLSGEGLVHIVDATIGGHVWRLEVRPAAGSSILVEAWRPAAVLGLGGVAVALVAALATFWYLREAQSRINLDNAGVLVSAKDRFVATVSHELRTPLAAVLGFSELLKDGGLEDMEPSERNEIVRTIAEQAGDLADIVEDLLVVARADHGTLATVAVPVDVAAQCRQVIERLASATTIPVVSAGDNTIRALGDPGRVRQILRNLLNNAASYGGTDIGVSIQVDKNTVRTRVEDDGNGVPPAQALAIFEPYRRAHAVSPTTGSLGLGLSVSRTLARHMGGDIVYHRADGVTIFELQLPVAEPPGLSTRSQPDPAERPDVLENERDTALA